jgi:hypothetical protein
MFKIEEQNSSPASAENFLGDNFADITGSDGGEYFENPDQARAYFKGEAMERLYPGWSKKIDLFKVPIIDHHFK